MKSKNPCITDPEDCPFRESCNHIESQVKQAREETRMAFVTVELTIILLVLFVAGASVFGQ